MYDPVSIIISPIASRIMDERTLMRVEVVSSLEGIKDALEKLSGALIKVEVIDEEDMQRADPVFKYWLGKLQDAASDAQDVLRAFSTKVYRSIRRKHQRGGTPSGNTPYTMHPRSLIPDSGQKFWKSEWKRESPENIELAKLKRTRVLNLEGAISTSELKPGITYEVVFNIKFKNGAFGWEYTVTAMISVSGRVVRHRQLNLYDKPRGEWIELNIGDFKTNPGETGLVSFCLRETGDHDKKGLVLKSAVVRPQS